MKDPKDHPVSLKGVKYLPATCVCGHQGKSQNPTWYRCGHCFYDGRAKGLIKRAAELRKRAEKLEIEAALHTLKAKAFRKKHPRPKLPKR